MWISKHSSQTEWTFTPDSFLFLPWVFVSHRGWAASCFQAVLMMSFKSLQAPAELSSLSLEIILEWHHCYQRSCDLLGQGNVLRAQGEPGAAPTASPRSQFQSTFRVLVCISAHQWDQGLPQQGISMCWWDVFAPGTLGSVAVPLRLCFGIRPKPQKFLCRLQVSTQTFGHISWKKKKKPKPLLMKKAAHGRSKCLPGILLQLSF